MDFDYSTDTITPDQGTTVNISGHLSLSGAIVPSNSPSITPAGTTQGTATAISSAVSLVPSSFSTANAGLVLPSAAVTGALYTVVNNGTVAVNVYPQTGATIDGAAANVAVSVPAGSTIELICTGSTSWQPVNKALVAGTNITITSGAGTLTIASTGGDSLGYVAPGTSGNVLTSNGTAWVSSAAPAAGGLRGIVGKAAAGALGAADVGMLVEINAAVALSLPAANTVPAGEGFLLHSTIAGATVARVGADVIYTGVGANSATSLTINRGEHLWLLSNGANGWFIGGGSAALSFADCFGGSVASPGWQKLPSGLILQWGNNSFSTGGSAITFPITFPNSIYGIMLGQGGRSGGYIFSQSQTLSGFSGYVSAGTTTTHWWLAFGR